MLILNDLHLGAQRKGGTTPASQEALRNYQFTSLRDLLAQTTETHLLIAGDLLDTFEVTNRDLIETYSVFSEWLQRGHKLTLIAGNHDVSMRGEKVSSFTLLSRFLAEQAPDKVAVFDIGESGYVDYKVWAIAHCANQDAFQSALTDSLKQNMTHLVLHCNLMSTFAEHSDHSLNLTQDNVRDLKDKGVHVLLAHEHNPRVVGNVTVLGCQFPTSIVDCLDQGVKWAHTLVKGELSKIKTWSADSDRGYQEINWRDLSDIPGLRGFVRIVGTATANEASDVVNRIAKLRKDAWTHCFVIANAVKVEGVAEAEDLPENFEAAKRFDVMDYIKQHLDGDEMTVVETLMKDLP